MGWGGEVFGWWWGGTLWDVEALGGTRGVLEHCGIGGGWAPCGDLGVL